MSGALRLVVAVVLLVAIVGVLGEPKRTGKGGGGHRGAGVGKVSLQLGKKKKGGWKKTENDGGHFFTNGEKKDKDLGLADDQGKKTDKVEKVGEDQPPAQRHKGTKRKHKKAKTTRKPSKSTSTTTPPQLPAATELAPAPGGNAPAQ